MAIRTISRDLANPRVVLVWPKDVLVDDVGTNDSGAHYAYNPNEVNGGIVQPSQISSDVFKAAFGFIPCSDTVARYIMRKVRAPETTEAKLSAAIKAIVKEVLDDNDLVGDYEE